MSVTIERPRTDDRDTEKFREVHLAPRDQPDVAYCGARRNGRPELPPGTEVTCVVCRDFQFRTP